MSDNIISSEWIYPHCDDIEKESYKNLQKMCSDAKKADKHDMNCNLKKEKLQSLAKLLCSMTESKSPVPKLSTIEEHLKNIAKGPDSRVQLSKLMILIQKLRDCQTTDKEACVDALENQTSSVLTNIVASRANRNIESRNTNKARRIGLETTRLRAERGL